MKEVGYSVPELCWGGYTAAELSATFSAEELFSSGSTLWELYKAGFPAAHLRHRLDLTDSQKEELDLLQLKHVGFSAADLRKCGRGAAALCKVGFSLQDLSQAGFTGTELFDAGFTLVQLQQAGFAEAALSEDQKAGADAFAASTCRFHSGAAPTTGPC
eukprot:Skav231313  [mRNA]  locus=scaffold1116:46428:46904:- [translate_table: standard]